MAQIIKFGRKKKSLNEARRWKAIAEGRVKYFTCDDCGGEIEVIDDDYPEMCPCCGLVIAGWNNEKENK